MSPLLQTLAAEGVSAAHGLTREPGDEVRLTREALERGFRRIVGVGGDGTWSNVAGAILRSGLPAELGLVPGGTGCDLAKSLGIPAKDLGACARIVKAGQVRTIDVGSVEDRYFLNVVGFGFDIAVIEDSWTVAWLGGDLLYLFCALRQLARFPGFPVEMSVDGAEFRRQELLMLIIANGLIFGGGFKINPRGDLEDGHLDAVAFGNMPLNRRLAIMGRLLQGTHARSPDVTLAGGGHFRLRFPAPPAYETDGEWNRARSAELEVKAIPAALRVLAP